jgi:hypothetical protein
MIEIHDDLKSNSIVSTDSIQTSIGTTKRGYPHLQKHETWDLKQNCARRFHTLHTFQSACFHADLLMSVFVVQVWKMELTTVWYSITTAPNVELTVSNFSRANKI